MPNRVALITGSSRGIGKAIAQRFAAQGIAVCINYRERREEGERVARAIVYGGGRALAVRADLTVAADCTELVRQAEEALGPIDILVNNAGVLRRGDLLDFDFSEMEGMRNVNVDGLVRMTRAVAGGMTARGWGRILNLTSIAAIGTSVAGTTFYAATKAAVIVLTRRFAMDLGPHGITVNAIAPGLVMTDMVDGQNVDAVAAKAMMRRVGQPADIAAAAAFLVSEDAGFITAQVLAVDGGRMDYIAHP